MRRAVPEVLAQRGDGGEHDPRFTAWIDELLSVATSAAMFGYHRELNPERAAAIDGALRGLAEAPRKSGARVRE